MTSSTIRISTFSLAVALATTISARGDAVDVSLDDCPAAVRKTIREESRGGAVDGVSKETEDGQTHYWADVVIGGKLFGIGVAEDGTLTEFSLQVDDHEIGLTDCPAAVQKTLREEAGKAKINDVRRESRLGITIYDTAVRIASKEYLIKVAEDGTLFEKILLIEEDEVPLADCPAAVRKTLEDEAKGNTIGDIVRSAGIGKRVYSTGVVINGNSYNLEVAEDGALISKTLDED